jgi:ribosomal protein S21
MHIDVRGTDDRSLDIALAEFKKAVKKAEILQDFKKHEAYVKPSVKKKLKRMKAIARRKQEEREFEKRRQRGVRRYDRERN